MVDLGRVVEDLALDDDTLDLDCSGLLILFFFGSLLIISVSWIMIYFAASGVIYDFKRMVFYHLLPGFCRFGIVKHEYYQK